MAHEHGLTVKDAVAALGLAIALAGLFARPVMAQQPRVAKLVPLSTLTDQGFEVKAAVGRSGVPGTLVLQKGKDVYLCSSKEIAIQPTAFECWPVK